jgi:hypothetical protein
VALLRHPDSEGRLYRVDRCEVEWNSEILGIKVPIEVRGTSTRFVAPDFITEYDTAGAETTRSR